MDLPTLAQLPRKKYAAEDGHEPCCCCSEGDGVFVRMMCLHEVCESCADKWFIGRKKTTCPTCRVETVRKPREEERFPTPMYLRVAVPPMPVVVDIDDVDDEEDAAAAAAVPPRLALLNTRFNALMSRLHADRRAHV